MIAFDLCRLRRAACGHRLSVQPRSAFRAATDDRLDDGVLLCFGGGEFGLSDSQRDLSRSKSRALAIAFFYAIGTAIGGVVGAILFGMLIDTGSRGSVAVGLFIGAALMIGAAVVEAIWGVAAERKPLEAVSRPLAFVD